HVGEALHPAAGMVRVCEHPATTPAGEPPRHPRKPRPPCPVAPRTGPPNAQPTPLAPPDPHTGAPAARTPACSRAGRHGPVAPGDPRNRIGRLPADPRTRARRPRSFVTISQLPRARPAADPASRAKRSAEPPGAVERALVQLPGAAPRSDEHTSELQSREIFVC